MDVHTRHLFFSNPLFYYWYESLVWRQSELGMTKARPNFNVKFHHDSSEMILYLGKFLAAVSSMETSTWHMFQPCSCFSLVQSLHSRGIQGKPKFLSLYYAGQFTFLFVISSFFFSDYAWIIFHTQRNFSRYFPKQTTTFTTMWK